MGQGRRPHAQLFLAQYLEGGSELWLPSCPQGSRSRALPMTCNLQEMEGEAGLASVRLWQR